MSATDPQKGQDENEKLLSQQTKIGRKGLDDSDFLEMKEVEDMMNLISTNSDVALLREAIFNPYFMTRDEGILKNGIILKAVLNAGHEDLAREMIGKGYLVPKDFIMTELTQDPVNGDLVYSLITNKFYVSDDSIILDYWYLVTRKAYDLSKLLESDPNVKALIGSYDVTNNPDNFCKDEAVLRKVLTVAFERKDEDSIRLINLKGYNFTKEEVVEGFKHGCYRFAESIWIEESKVIEKRRSKRTGSLKVSNEKVKATSKFTQAFASFLVKEGILEEDANLHAHEILGTLLRFGHTRAAKRVLKWENFVHQEKLIMVCINAGAIEVAHELIKRGQELDIARSQDLIAAINMEQYEIATDLLKIRTTNSALKEIEVQEKLVRLCENGHTIHFAAECLTRMHQKFWDMDLIKPLVQTCMIFLKAGNEMVNSHSPILTCVLMASFFFKLSNITPEHSNKCTVVANNFIEFATHLQDGIKDEDELKYYMLHQDTLNRTVFQIVASNRYYDLLSSDEIGSVTTKIWQGKEKAYGMSQASSLVRIFYGQSGNIEEFDLTRPIDRRKMYIFQFRAFITSCRMRYLAEFVSTGLLALFYQIVIYTAINDRTFDDFTRNDRIIFYVRLTNYWIFCIFLGNIMEYVFAQKTRRSYVIDGGKMVDAGLCVMASLQSLAVQKIVYPDSNYPDGSDELYYKTLISSVVVSIIVTLIWLKVAGVLLITKMLGPFLRMIYLMIWEICKFVIIFMAFMICMACIFTSLFYPHSEKFDNFSSTTLTLFNGAFGNYDGDYTSFTNFRPFASIMFGLYMIIATVMLLNLLIAVLSNVYSELQGRVDAENRAVTMIYYNRLKWNKTWGLLIFAVPPLNALSFVLAIPLMAAPTPKARKKWNKKASKMVFFFYAICLLIVYMAINLLVLIVAYFKGFTIQRKKGKLSIILIIRWLFLGIIFLLMAMFRDTVSISRLFYAKRYGPKPTTDRKKLGQYLNEDVIRKFQIILGEVPEDTQTTTLSEFMERFNEIEKEEEKAAKAEASVMLAKTASHKASAALEDPKDKSIELAETKKVTTAESKGTKEDNETGSNPKTNEDKEGDSANADSAEKKDATDPKINLSAVIDGGDEKKDEKSVNHEEAEKSGLLGESVAADKSTLSGKKVESKLGSLSPVGKSPRSEHHEEEEHKPKNPFDFLHRAHANELTPADIRRNAIREILSSFTSKEFDEEIPVEIMRKLLPVRVSYERSYIKRVLHTHVYYMNKAIKKFQNVKQMNNIVSVLKKLTKSVDRIEKICKDIAHGDHMGPNEGHSLMPSPKKTKTDPAMKELEEELANMGRPEREASKGGLFGQGARERE